MTRVLSELLGADEPRFSLTIRDLERAAGAPSTDVRLTAELRQRTVDKLKSLGLDPQDTEDKELYRVIEDKIAKDEQYVREALGISRDATANDILQATEQYVSQLPVEFSSFALKPSVAKRLMKKVPPKRAMKQLNYRSLESFIKHEHIAHVYVAAFLSESLSWRKKFFDQYNKLSPSDFESRNVAVTIPQTNRWKKLTARATELHRHNIIVVKELGVVVVLPMEQRVPGLAITSLLLILNALNDIASTGSYLKLQQVKPDFGSIVRAVSEQEPMTAAELVGRQVPWRVVHQYYARFKDAYNPVVFEPHVYASDMNWFHPEAILAQLHPSLEFWRDTRYTAYLHNKTSVSLNILDAALNYCNKLPYTHRVQQFVRQQLWHELMVRYLNQDNVEQAIAGELAPQLEFAEAN